MFIPKNDEVLHGNSCVTQTVLPQSCLRLSSLRQSSLRGSMSTFAFEPLISARCHVASQSVGPSRISMNPAYLIFVGYQLVVTSRQLIATQQAELMSLSIVKAPPWLLKPCYCTLHSSVHSFAHVKFRWANAQFYKIDLVLYISVQFSCTPSQFSGCSVGNNHHISAQ